MLRVTDALAAIRRSRREYMLVESFSDIYLEMLGELRPADTRARGSASVTNR